MGKKSAPACHFVKCHMGKAKLSLKELKIFDFKLGDRKSWADFFWQVEPYSATADVLIFGVMSGKLKCLQRCVLSGVQESGIQDRPLKSGKSFLRIHYTGMCLWGQMELWLGLSVEWMCSGVLWKHRGSSKLLPLLIEALNHQSWELELFHTIYGICASGRNWSVFITLVCCRNTDWEQMFVWKKSNSRVFSYCHTWNP